MPPLWIAVVPTAPGLTVDGETPTMTSVPILSLTVGWSTGSVLARTHPTLGERYTDITEAIVSLSDPRCATAVYDNSGYYSYKNCDADDLEGGNSEEWGSTTTSDGCVFPFSYLGVTYLTCSSVNSDQPWCATSVDTSGNYITWQYCESTYGNSGDSGESSTESSTTSTQITFSGEYCVPMIYGGVYYDACTSDDYGNLVHWKS